MADEVLDSWKAIAAFFDRDVRTVVRWEQSRGLPVRRIPGRGKPGVYALRKELDEWRTGARRRHAPDGTSGGPSIAVLPFSNLSSSEENGFFADGLADEVINLLTRIPGLRVTARTSSFAFREPGRDVREIGKKLGVRTLLEGSVRRVGRRLRVSAQLVDTQGGFHLWSNHFDGEAGNSFEIEDEISRSIAEALKMEFGRARGGRRPIRPEAYQCWQRGRYFQQYESIEAFSKSRQCFREAIELDPGFPNPHRGLGEVARAAAEVGILRPREALEEMRRGIERAMDLDGDSGETLTARGVYRAWDHFDWDGAWEDFERALKLTPGSAETHRALAIHFLVPTGRLPEAEREMQCAVSSDPVSPLTHIELGRVQLWRHKFAQAEATFLAALELRPDYWLATWYRGASAFFQHRLEEAVDYWRTVQRQVGLTPIGIGTVGMALGRLGRTEEARAALRELDAAELRGYVPQFSRAQVHSGLGETDAVFRCLERGIEDRDVHLLDLSCKPIWDGLRTDHRFTALLRTMRLR